MSRANAPSDTLTRYHAQGEAATLVQRVAFDRQPILLQTSDGSQAMLVPFDPEQAYFWTPEWQAAEREVDAQLLAGDYKDFDTIEDFVASLDQASDPADTSTE